MTPLIHKDSGKTSS